MDYPYIRYIFCDNKSIYDENRQLNIFMSPSRHVGKDIHACGLRCLNHVILYKINTTVGGEGVRQYTGGMLSLVVCPAFPCYGPLGAF